MEVIKDNFLQIHLDLLHFTENHTPLPLDLLLAVLGVLQDVGQDLDGVADVAGQALGVVDGLFSRRVGVDVGSHVLDFQLQLILRSLLRALNKHTMEFTK